MGSASDITSLFPQNAETDIGFRQGVVLEFNETTGENTVDVGGSLLTNIPLLSPGADSLGVGDVVGLLRSKTTYFIIGHIHIPPF